MSNFAEKLKVFLHDPVDKCFGIQTHIARAKDYAEKIKELAEGAKRNIFEELAK